MAGDLQDVSRRLSGIGVENPKHVTAVWQVLADALLQLFGKSLLIKPAPVKGYYSNLQI